MNAIDTQRVAGLEVRERVPAPQDPGQTITPVTVDGEVTDD